MQMKSLGTLALAALLLLTTALPARAAKLQSGVWQGIVSPGGGRQVRVQLQLTGSAGALSGTLRYGPPYDCALRLTPVGENDFNSSSTGGVYCDRVAQGRVRVEAVGPANAVNVSVFDPKGAMTSLQMNPIGAP